MCPFQNVENIMSTIIFGGMSYKVLSSVAGTEAVIRHAFKKISMPVYGLSKDDAMIDAH